MCQKMVGLEMVSLEMVGLEMVGLEMVGLEMVGLENRSLSINPYVAKDILQSPQGNSMLPGCGKWDV